MLRINYIEKQLFTKKTENKYSKTTNVYNETKQKKEEMSYVMAVMLPFLVTSNLPKERVLTKLTKPTTLHKTTTLNSNNNNNNNTNTKQPT